MSCTTASPRQSRSWRTASATMCDARNVVTLPNGTVTTAVRRTCSAAVSGKPSLRSAADAGPRQHRSSSRRPAPIWSRPVLQEDSPVPQRSARVSSQAWAERPAGVSRFRTPTDKPWNAPHPARPRVVPASIPPRGADPRADHAYPMCRHDSLVEPALHIDWQ